MNPKKKKFVFVLTLLAAISGSTWLAVADDDDDEDEEHEVHRGDALHRLPPVSNAAWKEECGSCHMLYLPSLLPERSWRKMMSGLEDHFGENATLDANVREEITQFLVAYSADRGQAVRGRRIAESLPAYDAPLRITETKWFKHKHDEIRAAVFKRKAIGSAANCVACHKQAESGNFDEDGVKIPK